VRRRLGVMLAVLVGTAGLLAGCTAARSGVGSADSSCFLALPAASQAVEGHGHFLGVHRFSVSGLRKSAPRMAKLLAAHDPTVQDICVSAYTGSFTSAHVSKPLGRAAGKLAVVITETGSNRVLGTVIFRHLPLRFSKSHIG